MIESNINFPSRISARAIVAATLCTFTLMAMSMLLAGAFGLWEYNFRELNFAGNGFWAWALISWIVCLAIGSYVSSMLSRAVEAEDGMLHGSITWASSSALMTSFLYVETGNIIGTDMSSNFMAGAFLTSLVALVGSVYAGYLGTRTEMMISNQTATKKEYLHVEEYESVAGK